jgi:hypothetical protein
MPGNLSKYLEKKKRDLTASEATQIRELILAGKGDVYELAETFGCVPIQIAWIKARMTMNGVWYPKGYEADVYALEKVNGSPTAVGEEKHIGQGINLDPKERKAVEDYSMTLAKRHFQQRGWKDVRDVSRDESYDLMCLSPGNSELHVEVKGTTSAGTDVILTRNEVTHARQYYPNAALFIVSGIQLSQDAVGEVVAHGGTLGVLHPWDIDADGSLEAVQYRYTLHGKAPAS